MKKWFWVIVILVFVGMIIGLLYYCLKPKPLFPDISKNEIVVDTILMKKPYQPVHIQGLGKLEYFQDTTNNDSVLNFVAMLDTICQEDTFNLRYEYPLNVFTLSMEPKQDSIIFKEILLKQPHEKWWIKPVLVGGGLVTGLLIGIILK
jgi:hypothetical protein